MVNKLSISTTLNLGKMIEDTLNHTDENNKYTAHKVRREDNPVNDQFAIDVIILEYKRLNVKGENELEKSI